MINIKNQKEPIPINLKVQKTFLITKIKTKKQINKIHQMRMIQIKIKKKLEEEKLLMQFDDIRLNLKALHIKIQQIST